jgi:REP element-mobilizing transposase RayT
MKNLSLFPDEILELIHESCPGRRKTARPLSKKRPIHLILKSRYILLTHRKWIKERIEDYAKRFGIRVFHHAISPDHVHFAIQIQDRAHYNKFVRSLTGVIARVMGKGMWSLLPYTRVASWGPDFENLLKYITRNHEETWLLRAYEPRKKRKRAHGKLAPPVLSPCVRNAL